MKLLLAVILLTLMSGCTDSQTDALEALVFKKTIESDLIESCSDDQACIKVVKEQIEPCMEKSNWKAYVDNSDDNEELYRFIESFYPCFKSPEGESYF